MPSTKNKNKKPQFRLRNTRQKGRQAGNERLIETLKPTENDIKLMLAAQVHIGRRRAHTNMKRYIWKRRKDGFHIINLEKTWNKLQLAARIFCGVKDPSDIMVISTRTYGQRGAIKFCTYTRASTNLGKWTPGTLCNPQNKMYKEPRLIIVDDPNTCFAALRETSYVGVPVIAFCGVDNNTRFVDCAIPCNNRGRLSIGLMFWLLAREIKRMKNEIKRTAVWDASVDLFFYRDPDEIKKDQEAKKTKEQQPQEQVMPTGPEVYTDNYPTDNYDQNVDGVMLNENEQWDQPPQQQLVDWGGNDEQYDDRQGQQGQGQQYDDRQGQYDDGGQEEYDDRQGQYEDNEQQQFDEQYDDRQYEDNRQQQQQQQQGQPQQPQQQGQYDDDQQHEYQDW